MQYKLPLLTLLSLSIAAGALAQKRIYVNEYLNIGVGGRGLGLAGSVAATANDVTSAYYNPAGMMQIKSDYQIGLMHAEYFSGNAKYDYAGIALPLKGKQRSLGLSFIRYATDDIAYTIDYVQPDGSFDDSKLKSISAGDYAFLITYAQGLKIFKNPEIQTNIGVNAKIIYRHIGSMANAWGAGIDAGLQASYRRWKFGIMLKDITTTYTSWSFHLSDQEKKVFGETGNEIPVKSYEVMYPRFNIGLARYFTKAGKPIQVMAEIDADITTDGQRNTLANNADLSLDPHAGIEASYKNAVFLRIGLGNIQRVKDDRDTLNLQQYTIFQPSVGVGVKLNALMIDYCYTSLQTQSNPLFSHIVSLRLDLNRARTSRKKPETGTAPVETTTPIEKP